MNIEEIYENNSDGHIDVDDFTTNHLMRRDFESLEQNEEGRIRFYETGINFHDN